MASNNQITVNNLNKMVKHKRRSLSSISGYLGDPSQEYSPNSSQFRRCSSFTALAELPQREEKTMRRHTAQHKRWTLPWRWSRMRRASRKNVIVAVSRRSADKYIEDRYSIAPSDRVITSADHSTKDINLVVRDRFSISRKDHASPNRYRGTGNNHQPTTEDHSNTSLCYRYQPKLFEDIAGQHIVVKAISSAVQKNKITHLYLFHGPSGTGKTSTARILAMALNCKSVTHSRPCWHCKGCFKSLYIMELCSGSSFSGFERIKTLIQSTSFAHSIPGFKVFIIEECHLLNGEAWDEILTMVEGPHGSAIVFVLITLNAEMLPRIISSRCQKYCFPKLTDADIKLKLARIAAQEGINLERDALQLIVKKAAGSLREAENILDQLTLLGTKITSSMVQQIVRLIPQDKLNDLLMAALSGDTMGTIQFTTDVIGTGIEPDILVSQLASLTKDQLSRTAVTTSRSLSLDAPTYNMKQVSSQTSTAISQQEKLCNALKILVGAENQSRSSIDPTTQTFAALLQIASQNIAVNVPQNTISRDSKSSPVAGDKSNTDTVKAQRHRPSQNIAIHLSIPKETSQEDLNSTHQNLTVEEIEDLKIYGGSKSVDKEPTLAHLTNLEEIWMNIVEQIKSSDLKEFLCHSVKLASLTISSANAIVHLMFRIHEDKIKAQMFEERISKALQDAIGCPVTVNMSLEPKDSVLIGETAYSTQSVNPQRLKFLQESAQDTVSEYLAHHNDSHHMMSSLKTKQSSLSPVNCNIPAGETEATSSSQQRQVSPETLSQKELADDIPVDLNMNLTSSVGTAYISATRKPKHRHLSLSSIQQSDASVERYSQDILFEHANVKRERKVRQNIQQRSFSGIKEAHQPHITAKSKALHQSWNCKDIFCQKRMKGKKNA